MRLLPIVLSAAGLLVAQPPTSPQTGNSGAYRIAGVVVSKTDGHPLARARIAITDPKYSQFLITGEDGKFTFDQVPAGKYSLLGSKRGFISGFYDQHEQFSTAIVTGAGVDTENLILKLAPTALISGRVLDEAGEPVRHSEVTLYVDNHQQGKDQIIVAGKSQTNDLGAYEFAMLSPGTYFLSAWTTPWYATHPASGAPESNTSADSETVIDRSLDVAYPVTYYPNVTEADSAAPIPLAGGERLQIDLQLNPAPALHLRFRVPGDAQHGYAFPEFEQSTFDGSTFVQGNGNNMVSPGVVEINGIPAGRYNIRFPGPNGSLQMNGVDLTKDGEAIDASAAEPLGQIKVSVQTAGETVNLSQFTIGLRAGSHTFAGVRNLDQKGQAQLEQIAPGRYGVLLWGSRKPYSIAHMTADGAQVVGHTVTVTAGASVSLTLTLVPGNVDVQGIVKRAGKPFAGAMVVLVPKDPEGNGDLFRRDQSDLDGTFDLRAVVPGEYTVIAIENGWDLDWSQPGVIAAYAKPGKVVRVQEASGQALNLAEAVEVQSK
jgi:hypothetical protein